MSRENIKIARVTKRMVLGIMEAYFQSIVDKRGEDFVIGQVDGNAISAQDMVDYATLTISQIEDKAKKASEKAEEKKMIGDELRDAVHWHLTDKFQSGDEITDAIISENEIKEVTKAKVVARVNQLIKMGIAEKMPLKDENGKKVVAYRLKKVVESES